jgi:tRNA(His) guanylyltransferase
MSAPSPISNREQVELFTQIADRLKRLERSSFTSDEKTGDLVLPRGSPFMARLDGHSFATFTRGIARPFDRRLATAMRRTAADLMREFSPDVAYTHSDEITLLWMPAFDDSTPPVPRVPMFNGRVHKINSLLSAFASVRFTFHLLEQFRDVAADVSVRNDFARSPDYDDDYVLPTSAQVGTNCETVTYSAQTLDKLRGFGAIFDSRVFALPEPVLQTLREYFAWRQCHDCRRNSTHALARSLFSTKQLESVSVPGMTKLLADAGVHYDAMDAQFREGVFVRRQLVELPCVDQKTGLPTVAMRHRFAFVHTPIRLTDTDAAIAWLTEKVRKQTKREIEE